MKNLTKQEALDMIADLTKYVASLPEEKESPTKELEDFLKHVRTSAHEMLDALDNNPALVGRNDEFWDKYSYKISTNGKTIVIPINAESNERLESYLEIEILEFEE